MRPVSVMLCLCSLLGCLAAATAARGQTATSLQEAISASPQAAAIVRGISGNNKIVGGDPVQIADHPWQAALIRGLVAEPTRSQFCGGSVIAPTWVLTAAHCVRNDLVSEDPKRVNVVVGTSQFFFGGQRIQVAAIYVHPKYVGSTHDSDFALLRLATAVTMGGTAVTRPVDLADAGTQLAEGTKTFVTGWGATSERAPGSLDLLGVELPVVANAVCNMPQSYNGEITATMLCAGRASGGIDSCQGDSGGPLTTVAQGNRSVLAGVVSWGDGCARRLKYGVYSRVTAALPWIGSTVGK